MSFNSKRHVFAFELDKLGDDAVPMVCNVSVADIESGSVKMPFTQRAAWAKVQSEDKAHKMLFWSCKKLNHS